jgi:hypothetical protein
MTGRVRPWPGLVEAPIGARGTGTRRPATSISAFTRVHSASKTRVNALMDALWALMLRDGRGQAGRFAGVAPTACGPRSRQRRGHAGNQHCARDQRPENPQRPDKSIKSIARDNHASPFLLACGCQTPPPRIAISLMRRTARQCRRAKRFASCVWRNGTAKFVMADQLGVTVRPSPRVPICPTCGSFRAPALPGLPLFRAAVAAYRCRGFKGTKGNQ